MVTTILPRSQLTASWGEVMIQVLSKSAKSDRQHFTQQSVTWEQFKTIQSAFDSICDVRLMYCEGALEIMGIGRLHEMICTLLTGLLMSYFTSKHISFVSTGAYTQAVEKSTEFQSDLSFNFEQRQEISDLCIEVVVTSGSTKKLRKYQMRNVPEVWFWEDGKISIYCLQNGEYSQLDQSVWLPELDIVHLEQCLLMDSHLAAMLAFQEKYWGRPN
jgi:Uma2 family endonuclease